MRTLALLLILAACGSPTTKTDSDDAKYAPEPNAKPCPPGNVLKGDACTPAVTKDQVAAVTSAQGKLDELAKLLDTLDTLSAPIQLLDTLRGLDEWKALASHSDKLKSVDDLVSQLSAASTQLHGLQTTLKSSSTHLGKLAGALSTITTNTGPARKLENVQLQVQPELHAVVDALQPQIVAAIAKVTPALSSELDSISDVLLGACTFVKYTGGSDKLTAACAQAKDTFKKAERFVDDVADRPAKLVGDVAQSVTDKLGDLANQDTKALAKSAQDAVDTAVKARDAAAKKADDK